MGVTPLYQPVEVVGPISTSLTPIATLPLRSEFRGVVVEYLTELGILFYNTYL
jgi:hypothetical protein